MSSAKTAIVELMGSILSMANNFPDVPAEVKENLELAAAAAINDTVRFLPPAAESEPDPATRLALRGMPFAAMPLLQFRRGDGGFRLARGRSPGLKWPPLKPTGLFALRCPICKTRDLSIEPSTKVHVMLEAWMAIRIDCCVGCAQRFCSPNDLQVGGCLCCFTAPASIVLRRDDNNACMLICEDCNAEPWLRMLRLAGIPFTRRAIIPWNGDQVESLWATQPSEVVRIVMPDAIASPCEPVPASPKKKPAARQRSVKRAHQSEQDAPRARPCPNRTCSAGCDVTDGEVAKCATDGCVAYKCGACLREEVSPSLVLIYLQSGNWRCPEHRSN